jgi:hypothetical protein
LISSKGALRPSCARPLGGPRVSSATWHRLGSAACCLGCLLRGTTAHLLATTHLASPVYPSCMHWCWCAYSGHLLLGAPTQRVKRRAASSTPVPGRGGRTWHLSHLAWGGRAHWAPGLAPPSSSSLPAGALAGGVDWALGLQAIAVDASTGPGNRPAARSRKTDFRQPR